jgi:hypothetical protein
MILLIVILIAIIRDGVKYYTIKMLLSVNLQFPHCTGARREVAS